MGLKVKEFIDLLEKGVKEFNVPEDAVIGADVRGKIETFKSVRFDLDDWDDYGWWLSTKERKKFEIDITDEGDEVESLKEWKKVIEQHQPSNPIQAGEFLCLLKNTKNVFDGTSYVFCSDHDINLIKDGIWYNEANNVMVIGICGERNLKMKKISKELNVFENPSRWNIAEDQKNVPAGMIRVVTSDMPRITVKDLKKAIKSLSDDDYVVVNVDDYFYCGIATDINTEDHTLEINRTDYGDRVDCFELVDKKEFEAAKNKIETEEVLGYVWKRTKIAKRILKHAKAFIDDPEFAKLSSFKIAVGSKRMYLDILLAPSREKIDAHLDAIHNDINDKLSSKKYHLDGYKLEVTNLQVIQHNKDINDVSLNAIVKITKL